MAQCTEVNPGWYGGGVADSSKHEVSVIARFKEACGKGGLEHLGSAAVTTAARDLSEVAAALRVAAAEAPARAWPAGSGDAKNLAITAQASAVSDAAGAVLQQIVAQASFQESGKEPNIRGPSAELTDPVLSLGFRLCSVLLDVAVCTGLCSSGASEAVSLVLGFVRRQQDALSRLFLRRLVMDVFNSLGCLVQTRTLDGERLRCTLVIAMEAFICHLTTRIESGSAAAAESAADVLVASVAAAAGSRVDSFELLLEVVQKRAATSKIVWDTSFTSSLARVLLRSLTATCAPAVMPGPAREWMPRCYQDARHCARRMAVQFLQCASHSNAETKAGIERLMSEVAAAALQPQYPAAPLALKALAGSLTVILQARGVGDMKVLAIRILGRAAACLSEEASNISKEGLCTSCAQTGHDDLPSSVADGKHEISADSSSLDASEQTQSCSEPGAKSRMNPETCEMCLLSIASRDLSQRGLPLACTERHWAVRHLLLRARRQAVVESSLPSSLQDSTSSTSELAFTTSFHFCEWAAEVWPHLSEAHQPASTSRSECNEPGEQFISELWKQFTQRSFLEPGSYSQLSEMPTTRMLKPYMHELRKTVALTTQKATRAILLQLRSPRPLLRAAALRALGAIAEAGCSQKSASQPVPRPVLLSLLTKDPSANVRRAALALVGHTFSGGDPQKDHKSTDVWHWAMGAIRLAIGDVSLSVRNAACSLLSTFVRKNPDSHMALDVCRDLVTWTVTQTTEDAPSVAAQRVAVFEDLRIFTFGGTSGLRVVELMQLLAIAHNLGSRALLPGLLSAHSSAVSAEQHRAVLESLAATLVSAVASAPEPAHIAALLALSQAAPQVLADHALSISVYLAVGSPPSASEEVLALGACAVLADVLAALGRGATRALWRSAWARVDRLVSEHGSRLARPAMRCLCVAANAEGSVAPILVHLRGAVRVLQAEVRQPSGSGALVRAAWIAATACEYCDLNQLITPCELGYKARLRGGHLTTGAAIATDLLRVYGSLAVAKKAAALPALILALGFALRRHTWLAASPAAAAVFAHGLAGGRGSELLAERALEALAQLLEHLTGRAEAAGASGESLGPTADEAMSHLARNQPAVLRLLGYGLHRRAEATDVPLRARALAAARAFHRAGLGHPGGLALALFAPLFADRSLRRGAAALLSAVAGRDPNAVVTVVVSGIRSAFAAMLWQAPHQLSFTGAPGLTRAAVEARRAFTAVRATIRARWLRALLTELQSLQITGLRERLPPLPAEALGTASTPSRLSPFGSSAGRKRGSTASYDASPGSTWQPSERLSLSYGHFVANVIVALPLSESEVQVLIQETTRYFEFRAAAAISAYEHGESGAALGNLVAVCASAIFCRSLAHAFSSGTAGLSSGRGAASVTAAGMVRLQLFQEAVYQQLQTLAPASQSGSEQVARWLTETLEQGPKLQNAPRRRRPRGLPVKRAAMTTPRPGKRLAAQLTTPSKRRLSARADNSQIVQKTL